MKNFRIALALAAASVAAPITAQEPPENDPDQSPFARVWNILDADRDMHPVIVYVRDTKLIRDTFDDRDIVVTGPDGFTSPTLFDEAQPISSLGGGSSVGWEVRYLIPVPEGGWTKEMNGTYRVNLQPGELERTDGTSVEAQTFGGLQVIIDDVVAPPAPTVSIKRTAFPLHCDPDQPPESCRMRWIALVEGNAAEGTYIRDWNEPHLSSATQFDETRGVWFVELQAANTPTILPDYPYWLPWLAVVDLAPPLGARRHNYRFHPEVGPATFEVRYQGNVVASETFTAIDGPKFAFVDSEPVAVAGTPSNILTFKFYMPGGIDQSSLGRNFEMEETKPGRPQPPEPRFLVARRDASGWLEVDYEISAPTGGWIFDDKGSYSVILKEDSIMSLSGEPFPSQRSGGFVEIRIPDPAIPIRATMVAAPVTRPGAVHTDAVVTYQSLNDLPIDLTSIDRHDLRLSGFNGSSTRLARPLNVVGSQDDHQVVATYRIPGPTFGFRAGDSPIRVALYSRQVKTTDGRGNTVQMELGSIPINIDPDAPGVFPSLASSDLTGAGHRPFRFRVRYLSRSAINPDQLQTGGIKVRADWLESVNFEGEPPIWLEQDAKLIDVDVREDGTLLNATYEISPPEIGWSHLANGPLTVTSVSEVTNASGDPPRTAETLGEILVRIPRYDFENPQLQLFKAAVSDDENQLAAIATLRLSTAKGTVVIGDWREPLRKVDDDGNATVFLDATAGQADLVFGGPIPVFFDVRHRYVVDIPDPSAEETVVFRLNGEALVAKTVRLDGLEREPLLPSRAESIADLDDEDNRIVRSVLGFEIAGTMVESWGEVVLNGRVLTANAIVSQDLEAGDPELQLLEHEYTLPIEEAGFYQFIQSVNGEPVSEVFFHAITHHSTSFSSWLQQQINTFVHAPRRGDSITMLGDLDADGSSDFEEWAFGSGALDPAQQPSIDAVIVTSGEGEKLPAVRFFRPANVLFHHYRLERSSDLSDWETVPEEDYEFTTKNGGLQETTVTLKGDPEAFRNHYVRMAATGP